MAFVIALVIITFFAGVVIGWGMAPFIDMLCDEDRYDYLDDEPRWRDG